MLNIKKCTEYTIYCDKCNIVDFIQDCDGAYRATDTPTKFFTRIGWREIDKNTLCPECARNENKV